MSIKPIAFYLPQFHPIPENDMWWGKGFTEWTNVVKAKPLFKNHRQPKLPSDLGFYDLRVSETRELQAELARQHGIYGFCYWHYWFGRGKRLLQRPFEEVLNSKSPNFPFCLAWANETWSGIWHGSPEKVLMTQEYLGEKDYINHFNLLRKSFDDDRYIRINNKPLFLIYKPQLIPDLTCFIDVFRNEALKSGYDGLYLVSNNAPFTWNPNLNGLDAGCPTTFGKFLTTTNYLCKVKRFVKRKIKYNSLKNVFSYEEVLDDLLLNKDEIKFKYLPCVIPNWDNSPRSGKNAVILHNSSPELFSKHLNRAIGLIKNYDESEQIIFLKSWNEWAEGNYLEPDVIYGTKYLEVLSDSLKFRNKF